MKTLNKQPVLIDAILPLPATRILAIARDIALVLSFALLTGFCAKLKIEIGAVPITMQTFAVLLSGALLGSKRGALSQLTYLLMGLAGIPWFSRGGGMAYILSPTFGYIIGFVFAAYLIGWLCERGFDRQVKTAILAMLLGNIILYIPGLLWLAKFVGFKKVLAVGLYPFIIGDLLKLLLAGSILPLAWKLIK
ncbi:MAG: biotin transporter BioY [Patescibacteria group bacterium]|nr:biotin transporter BioY [Patescibacteria group bacterium]